jgi:hypothetical protein
MLAAAKYLKTLQPLATSKSSAELRALMAGVERKAIFSARTNLVGYTSDIKAAVLKYLSGDTNLATAKLDLLQALQQYGYTPEQGFPQAPDAAIPPAEAGSLQDLSSDARLKLVAQTNFRQATNYMKKQAGNEPDALEQFPAWELIRVYPRQIERGQRRGPKGTIVEDPGADWPSRFREAAQLAGDDDALRVLDETGRMIARKDSPLWTELGNPDNFDDAIGTDYPPFAFSSGMGWTDVDRAECVQVGLIDEGDQIAPAGDSEFAAELEKDAASATLSDLQATRNALLDAAAKLRGAT